MAHYIADSNAIVTGVLAAAVANAGTFTTAYPSGTSQQEFDTGLAGPRSELILNGNDRLGLGAGGFSLAFGASLVTVTNNSGATWPAGARFVLGLDRQDGNECVVLTIPISNLADIAANGDVVTEMRPGIDGVIEYAEFVCTRQVTTAARSATLNLEIGTVDVTGMTCALTSANLATRGVVVPFTLPTGANTLTRASRLSVEAAAVTAFAEGAGHINIRVRKSVSV